MRTKTAVWPTSRGITLLELVVAVLIVALLTSIGLPSYHHFNEQACINQTIIDMRAIENVLVRYHANRHALPDTLDAAGITPPLDCWNRPLVYTKYTSPGHARKDRRENPLNSDFDLYSLGPDGESAQSLRNKISHDDIIRARNGQFFGQAKDF